MPRVEQEGPITPLSKRLDADRKTVETDLAYVEKTLVDLIPRRFEKYPAFKTRRGKDAPGEGPFDRLEVEMTASAAEVAGAPREVQGLLLDLGVKKGDEIAIQLSLGKKNRKAPDLADRVYQVVLIPTTHRPDLFGYDFDYWNRTSFLESGSPFEGNHPAEFNGRSYRLIHAYDILENGLVSESHEVGTHASYTEYDHMPHPYLAATHRGVADWIVSLIDARMK